MDIEVLGSLEVVVGDDQVPMTSPSQRRVLAALVVSRGEIVAADRLADLTGLSLRALRTAISRIRSRVGEEVIATRPEGYTLGAVSVDADRFENHLGRARGAAPSEMLTALDSALRLWRGDPYGDCSDIELVQPAATRLVELRASATEDRGEALIALGRFSDAAAAMSAHAAQHPLRDRPVELEMRALAAQGRRTEALRRYRNHRTQLLDEVGVEPGDQLVDLDAKIATGWRDTPSSNADSGLSVRRTAPGNVRPHLTPLIGRESDLDTVADALARHRLVTLIGVGGVGKTRLAIESALQSPGWPDGRWLVELGVLHREEDVAEVVARTLGIRQTPGQSIADSVVRWCGQRRLLLVLDNCEHVVRSAARLAAALTGSTDSATVLATSREPLMVSGEHVLSVPPLSLREEDGGTGGAVDLFVARAKAELPSFDPTAHGSAIASICARLDGLPLAIELAAARVRGLPVDEIASRLDERFGLLTGGRRTAVERHTTLRATVDWSFNLLDDRERNVFDGLSAFSGPFSLDDALAMADEHIGDLTALDTISRLVDRSMVVRGDTPPEYRLLETLRAYGRERLESARQVGRITGRHLDLMAGKAAWAREHAAGPDEDRVVRTLQAQFSDYGAAIRWAVEHDAPDRAVRIAEDLFIPVSLWGINAEPGLWMRDLLHVDYSSPRITAANRWLASHWYMFFGNDLDRSIDLATEAVQLDPRSAWAHVMSTFGAMLAGREDDARTEAIAAQGLARDAGERAACFIVLGSMLLKAGEVDQAAEVADNFAAWADDRAFASARGMAYHLKGRTLAENKPVRALETFERGLEFIRREIPGCWNVESNIMRELIPLVNRIDASAAADLAIAALTSCVRHNETGNIVGMFAHAASILAGIGLAEVAAKAVGAAGESLLGPTDARVHEQTKQLLQDQLGHRYDVLVAEGAQAPVLRTAQDVIGALHSWLHPDGTGDHAVESDHFRARRTDR